MMQIVYSFEPDLSTQAFRDILIASTLAERRPADSDEGGHQFQFDRGHHSNLMAARLASSRRPVLLMS
jgi:hypothetical protein